jgi:peptidoglycan/LPS O-acetylase OafA/YrhL
MLLESPTQSPTHTPRLTTSAPSSPTPDRLHGVEAARFLAILGVVWFHAIQSPQLAPSGVLGRSSVGFFTLAAMLFLVQSVNRRHRSIPAYTLDRLLRLGIPFVAWSAINLAVMFAINRAGYHIDLPTFSSALFADGGTIHLWYIPFLFVASILIYPFTLWMRNNPARRWIIFTLCIAIALSLDLGLFDALPKPTIPLLTRFAETTAERWSAVYWGVAFAILWFNGLNRSRLRIPLAIAGGLLLLSATIWEWNFHIIGPLKTYAGFGLLALSLAPWNYNWVRALAPLGRLTPGVYFAHMAALYIARYLLMLIHFPNGPTSDLLAFTSALLLSFSFIALMARTPGLQSIAGVTPTKPTPKKV